MTSLFSFAILAATAAIIFSQSVGEENSINPVVDTTSSNEEARARSERAFRRLLPSLPNRNQNRGRIHDIQALRQTLDSGDWSQVGSAPSIPPAEANCFVEVQLTQRIPGRCTTLAGRIPACQAQDIMSFDYAECSNYK